MIDYQKVTILTELPADELAFRISEVLPGHWKWDREQQLTRRANSVTKQFLHDFECIVFARDADARLPGVWLELWRIKGEWNAHIFERAVWKAPTKELYNALLQEFCDHGLLPLQEAGHVTTILSSAQVDVAVELGAALYSVLQSFMEVLRSTDFADEVRRENLFQHWRRFSVCVYIESLGLQFGRRAEEWLLSQGVSSDLAYDLQCRFMDAQLVCGCLDGTRRGMMP